MQMHAGRSLTCTIIIWSAGHSCSLHVKLTFTLSCVKQQLLKRQIYPFFVDCNILFVITNQCVKIKLLYFALLMLFNAACTRKAKTCGHSEHKPNNFYKYLYNLVNYFTKVRFLKINITDGATWHCWLWSCCVLYTEMSDWFTSNYITWKVTGMCHCFKEQLSVIQ